MSESHRIYQHKRTDTRLYHGENTHTHIHLIELSSIRYVFSLLLLQFYSGEKPMFMRKCWGSEEKMNFIIQKKKEHFNKKITLEKMSIEFS